MRSTPASESAQTLLFRRTAPGQGSSVASWHLLPSPPAPGCRGWQSRGHAAQLCASTLRFIPSRYTVAAFYLDHFSVLWYFTCFSNPSPSPLPSPVAGFLRRIAVGESCRHICSLAAASRRALSGAQGSGSQHGLGSAGWRQGSGPLAREACSGHAHCSRWR